MSEYTLIFNKQCSKSRGAKEILDSKGIEYKTINYLDELLTEGFLRDLFSALKLQPKDVIRTKELASLNSDLDLENSNAVIQAIIKNPILLERPILLKDKAGVIARPPEKVLDLI